MENLSITTIMQHDGEVKLKDKLAIVFQLSIPAILAQISEIIMEYIDAGMVGSLGAEASASIGLVASSTWLFGGLLSACVSGFSVQVAHATGANNISEAKHIFRQAIVTCIIYGLIFTVLGVVLSNYLPIWLGAEQSLWTDATLYFKYFSVFIIVRQFNILSAQMLQCTGDMKTPSLFLTLSCILDVIFNFFFIFPSRDITVLNHTFHVFGFGMGVLGAQIGTSLSILVAALGGFYFATIKNPILKLTDEKGSWMPKKETLQKAFRIGGPLALQQSGLSLAQIVATRIVAPLGTIAIAANSFAVTVESICYMPGFGISSAATTLVGQSFGARKKDLAKSFAWIATSLGMFVMASVGMIMFFFSPYIFQLLTPVKEVQELGVEVIRVQLLVEALFAAAIVVLGCLRGAGDTLIPGIINICCMWFIRLTLAAFLAPRIGLIGVWIAMAIDNSVAGILMLIRLYRGKWLERLN